MSMSLLYLISSGESSNKIEPPSPLPPLCLPARGNVTGLFCRWQRSPSCQGPLPSTTSCPCASKNGYVREVKPLSHPTTLARAPLPDGLDAGLWYRQTASGVLLEEQVGSGHRRSQVFMESALSR